MKDYYETQIKPQNTELGRSLGIRNIDVKYQESLREVPVTYRTRRGHMVKLTASERELYRSTLGLIV